MALLVRNDNNVNEFDFTDKQTQNIMDLISHQHNQTLPITLNPFADKNIVVPDEMNDTALLNNENRISPCITNFTNPESDSHVQYYSHLNGDQNVRKQRIYESIKLKNTIKIKNM